MNICGTEIETPWDDRANFSPKWRHQVASAMVGKKIRGMLPSQIKLDKIIKRQYDYLSHLQNIRQIDDGNYYNSILRYPINNTVTRWFDCQTGVLKHYLEALLLTDRESTEIAQDLNTDVEMVNEYEKLFFNIRDNYARTAYSPALKIKFAIGNVIKMADLSVFELWKLIGAQLGYAPLVRSWGWKLNSAQSDEVDEETYQRSRGHVINRVVKGEIGNFDINTMQANHIAGKRLLLDAQDKSGAGSTAEVDLFGIELLQALRPVMIKVDQTLEAKAATNAAIQQKLLVQKDIDDVQLVDKGPQNAAEEFKQELQRKAESLR